MAMAVVYTGMSCGWLAIPVPASFLFTKYGFSTTMFLMAPWMLIHVFGVIFYTQEGKRVDKENIPESMSLKESLIHVFTNIKVHSCYV